MTTQWRIVIILIAYHKFSEAIDQKNAQDQFRKSDREKAGALMRA